jgi:methyl-accepting chemotaxis protein
MKSAVNKSVRFTASIKYRFLVFSIALFFALLAGGGTAFFVAMNSIIRASAAAELSRLIETRRLSLEGQVNGEITLALKMADSPLIRRYFAQPDDEELEQIAFAEIAAYRAAFTGNNVFWINDADKRYYFGDSYVYTLNPADADSQWYTWTLTQKELYNFNVSYDVGLKKTMLWINAQVFEGGREKKGRAIGIVGTGIDLTDFITALFGGSDGAGFASSAELFLFNAQGEITGAKDSALMEAKETMALRWGAEGSAVVEAAEQLSGREVRTFTLGGTEYAVGTLPLLNWYMAVSLPLKFALILQNPMTALFMAIILIVFLLFVIINVFIFRLVKPLNKSVFVLGEIAATWDLTRRLDARGGDETGRLGEIFNLTFEKIQALVTVIRDKTCSLLKTGAELASEADATADSVRIVTEAVQNMTELSARQTGEAARVGSSMTKIIERLQSLNGHIEEEAESVSQSSSAIEEMFANIHSVAETLIKNDENVKALSHSAEVSREDLQNAASEFKEIARQSEGLLEINAVMENIASQTNLLSMNASIEAAHAGDTGKGFAVVASEIRKLAENSSKQSQTTADMLKKIKTSIDAVTRSTARVLDRFETISLHVKLVADQEAGIRSAMEEQEVGNRQILEAVTRLKELSDVVRSEAENIACEGRDAVAESKTLERVTAEIERGMNEAASGAQMINSALKRISQISSGNKNSIDTLSEEVMKFKV